MENLDLKYIDTDIVLVLVPVVVISFTIAATFTYYNLVLA